MQILTVFAAPVKAGIAGAAAASVAGLAAGIVLPLAFKLELTHAGSYEGAGVFAVFFAPVGGLIAGVVGWLGWAIQRATGCAFPDGQLARQSLGQRVSWGYQLSRHLLLPLDISHWGTHHEAGRRNYYDDFRSRCRGCGQVRWEAFPLLAEGSLCK